MNAIGVILAIIVILAFAVSKEVMKTRRDRKYVKRWWDDEISQRDVAVAKEKEKDENIERRRTRQILICFRKTMRKISGFFRSLRMIFSIKFSDLVANLFQKLSAEKSLKTITAVVAVIILISAGIALQPQQNQAFSANISENAMLKNENLVLKKQVSVLMQRLEEKTAQLAELAAEKQSPLQPFQLTKPQQPELKLIDYKAPTPAPIQTQTKKTAYIEKSGETVWGLLNKALGKAPTWEQIKTIASVNKLPITETNGQMIVLVEPGQALDLSPILI